MAYALRILHHELALPHRNRIGTCRKREKNLHLSITKNAPIQLYFIAKYD